MRVASQREEGGGRVSKEDKFVKRRDDEVRGICVRRQVSDRSGQRRTPVTYSDEPRQAPAKISLLTFVVAEAERTLGTCQHAIRRDADRGSAAFGG